MMKSRERSTELQGSALFNHRVARYLVGGARICSASTDPAGAWSRVDFIPTPTGRRHGIQGLRAHRERRTAPSACGLSARIGTSLRFERFYAARPGFLDPAPSRSLQSPTPQSRGESDAGIRNPTMAGGVPGHPRSLDVGCPTPFEGTHAAVAPLSRGVHQPRAAERRMTSQRPVGIVPTPILRAITTQARNVINAFNSNLVSLKLFDVLTSSHTQYMIAGLAPSSR